MKTKLIVSFICSLNILPLYAQVIEGKVTDKDKPVPAVTVSLLRLPDSSLLKITASGKDGSFRFGDIHGIVIIKITAVNYTTYTSDAVEVGKQNISLPIIVLQSKTSTLQDVSVTAIKPLIQYKGDKMIVNLDAAPSNAGATLLEVLSKMPGVTIDPKGIITLKGKTGVMIMIDGKETFLSGEDLTNLLRNMPASGSDQIEIISNPSSRYDASATGGIINIKSKKSLKQGLNGAITIAPGMALYKDQNKETRSIEYLRNSANWNYRKNKINLFGNAAYSINQYMENFFEQRYFFNNNLATGSVITDNFFFSPSRFYQLRAGLDIYITKKSILGIIAGNNYSTNTSSSTTATMIKNANNSVAYLMDGLAVNPGSHSFNGSYNMNYKYTPGINNSEFTADLNYILYRNTAKVGIESRFFDPFNNPTGDSLILKQRTSYDFDVYVAKADYTRSIGKWRMETGIKKTYTKSNSDQFFEKKTGGIYTADASRNNTFIYTENINAAYLILAGKTGKTDLQMGLRAEQTIGKGIQKAIDSSFKRRRIDFFPSFVLNLEASPKYNIGFSYSRKLNRPSFRNLNPFVYVTDSLYSFQGNPFLLPQFSHNFEITHLISNKINITFGYSFFNKLITNLVQNDPFTKVTRTYIDNFNKYKVFSASVTVPVKPAKWWNLTFNSQFEANHYSGIMEALPIDLHATLLYLSVSNSFTFSSVYSADVNAEYYTKRLLSALIYFDYPFNYDIGIRRKFADNKGNLSLSMNTPFFFPARTGKAAYGNTFFDQRAAFANQRYGLSFTYRFGKTTIEAQRNKKNASAEEQGRL